MQKDQGNHGCSGKDPLRCSSQLQDQMQQEIEPWIPLKICSAGYEMLAAEQVLPHSRGACHGHIVQLIQI